MVSSSAAQYPEIHSSRPRVYADSARLAWLKENVTQAGECQDTYNSFLFAYNNWWINDPQLYLLGSDSTLWTWNWSSQWAGSEAFYTAFIYKLTDDSLALKRCRFLAEQVIDCIDGAEFPAMEWYAKENLLRQMSDAGDILLDWCYDDLPAEMRDRLARSIYAMNREFMNTFILSSAGNSYVSSHNTWNTIFCNQNTLTLHDASGLTSAEKDTVMQWYNALQDKLTDGFIPCWTYYRDDDGGWNWGAAYAMWSLVDQFQLFENMHIATDKNYFEDLPWVRNSINQYVYFMQPNNRCIHLGDGETGMAGDRVTYLHARYFNDPRSLWMAQYWSDPTRTPNTNQKFAKLLYKDFAMPPVTQPMLPLDWWADKVGLSVSRSSWDDDATMVTFFNSPSKRAAHEHRDNNSFTIFKNAPLLIDAGYYDTYGGEHYRNYYQRTIAHNSICVFDSSDSYACFGQPASNDGGQIESPALQNYSEIFLAKNQRGQWILNGAGTGYQYSVADAQLSYDSAKVSFFRRKLLYLKPDRMFVVDYLHLKSSATRQRDVSWIAHVVNRPSINGEITAAPVPGHIETWNGNIYTASNGDGSVSIKTLLPEHSTATVIGGVDHEYFVDGVNYPPLSVPDSVYYTPGAWRIEVHPSAVKDTLIFLHEIRVGDSSAVPTVDGLALKSQYSIGADSDATLLFFSADGTAAQTYHSFDVVAGDRAIDIVAADLLPGPYFIKVDGSAVASTAADTNGLLFASTLLGSGTHSVEIANTSTAVGEDEQRISFEIYPSPVRSELSIISDSAAPLHEVRIYNSIGMPVRVSGTGNRIDVSDLSPGLYFVRVVTGEESRLLKFIKE